MSQGNQPFPGRPVYASSSKLPDRTALKPGAAPPPQAYSQSTFGRRPEQSYQFGQSTAAQQQHGPLGARQSMEKESNALSELSEEQRDEINEAVGTAHIFSLVRAAHTIAFSFLYSTSIETDIWTIMNCAWPCDHWDFQSPNPKLRR